MKTLNGYVSFDKISTIHRPVYLLVKYPNVLTGDWVRVSFLGPDGDIAKVVYFGKQDYDIFTKEKYGVTWFIYEFNPFEILLN